MQDSATDLVAPRRETYAVSVAGVLVGGGHPVVVQSMTNTDTADINATVDQVAALARAGSELVRITVDRDEAAKAVPHIRDGLARRGVRRAARRRLPLHRPQAAGREPGRGGSARQVSHQSRQRRLQGEEGPPVRCHHRHRAAARKAGAHRRQLGLARSRAADAPDGREREEQRAEGCARRHARGDRAVGTHLGRACRGAGARARPHHPLGEGVGGAGSRQRLHEARRARPLRSARRPHGSRHGVERHRRLDRRHRPSAASRHRRHDPRLAHARSRRRPHDRGKGRAGDPAEHGIAVIPADRRRVSRMRAHDVDGVPGARARRAGDDPRPHARMAAAVSRGRDAEPCRHGLHRQWPRGIEAGRHRDLAARYGRGTDQLRYLWTARRC